MQAIQDFFEHRLIFQRYSASNELSGRYLSERELFRKKRIAKGEDVNIDFENELFYAVKPFLYRIISECKNHCYHTFGYLKTSFEIFLVPNDGGRWITMIEGSVENNESIHTDEIDFISVDRYGSILNKPFSLRLFTHNFYENLLPDYLLNLPIPACIPFEQENCVI